MEQHPAGPPLLVRGVTIAQYVTEPDIDPCWSPRPYLHPVWTLAGVPVTDALPEDHRWHLGVSVAMQDVSGTNLWGGRTYRRGTGYTWRNDHGRIVPDAWSHRGTDGFVQRLRWLDPFGAALLVEERTVTVGATAGRADAWQLDFDYTLTAPAEQTVTLGSPATNGRPGGAGYGGFFWRVAPGRADTFTATADGEEAVNGSTESWLALGGRGASGAAYTLVFAGLADGDHWFVRTGIYPGVCAVLAFERPLSITAGSSLRRRHRVLVLDGAFTRDQVAGLL